MTSLKRTILTKDQAEKDTSEKRQFRKGTTGKKSILKRSKQKQGTSEKEEKYISGKGISENDNYEKEERKQHRTKE